MSNAPQNIPWFEPLIDSADTEAVTKTVASGFVNEGPENRAFEKDLCAYFGVPFALSAPSCTMALALSLKALEYDQERTDYGEYVGRQGSGSVSIGEMIEEKRRSREEE